MLLRDERHKRWSIRIVGNQDDVIDRVVSEFVRSKRANGKAEGPALKSTTFTVLSPSPAQSSFSLWITRTPVGPELTRLPWFPVKPPMEYRNLSCSASITSM